jgi:hypothetical protein
MCKRTSIKPIQRTSRSKEFPRAPPMGIFNQKFGFAYNPLDWTRMPREPIRRIWTKPIQEPQAQRRVLFFSYQRFGFAIQPTWLKTHTKITHETDLGISGQRVCLPLRSEGHVKFAPQKRSSRRKTPSSLERRTHTNWVNIFRVLSRSQLRSHWHPQIRSSWPKSKCQIHLERALLFKVSLVGQLAQVWLIVTHPKYYHSKPLPFWQ